MRYLRCKCGEREMWTTDGVQDCQGCEKCGTTFSGHPDGHNPLQPHQWKTMYDQNTGLPYKRCEKCYHVDEVTYKLAKKGISCLNISDVDKFYEGIIHTPPIEEEGRIDKLPEDDNKQSIPKNLEEAINLLTNNEIKDIIKDKTEDKFICEQHHGLGMLLRNNWGLWRDSDLAKWFNEKGIHHADDMSSIILASVYRVFNNKEIGLDEQIQHYREYWQDVDPSVNK